MLQVNKDRLYLAKRIPIAEPASYGAQCGAAQLFNGRGDRLYLVLWNKLPDGYLTRGDERGQVTFYR